MKSLRQKFEDCFIPVTETGCWLWNKSYKGPGYKRGLGYGQINVKGRNCGAHRIAWQLFRGEIPRGMSVLHKCDVRICVNPDHLFLGTALENMRDMTAKGRHGNKSRITHCPFGHPYDNENTKVYVNKHGWIGRHCKACARRKSLMHSRSETGKGIRRRYQISRRKKHVLGRMNKHCMHGGGTARSSCPSCGKYIKRYDQRCIPPKALP